uniref:Gamma-tubulin complex component 6 n=1 Tax=Gasterosteus aculeatus aculeatus TaxID=481459 RepID=G3NIK9_GASAC
LASLLGALCDSSLSGVSWKRRALGGISREGFRRALKKCAYGSLLSKLFQDDSKGSASRARITDNTPPKNKVLMICFDLRVAGCREEAERLEEQLGMLHEGASSGLKEINAVLELLVHLAGSAPPPPTSFSRDYMRRERPVLRRPQPWGYQSEELQRLEARAWGLVCGEEWGTLESLCGTQRLMDAPPGTGLLALRSKLEAEERFERDTRMTLFGALQHTRTSDIDIRLDLPPVPSNIDVTGLTIRVPSCLDQSEDEGFQSASNMTPDSMSETSPLPDIDIWEALRTFEPGKRRCWESVGCPPGKRESLYLTEGGREAFDQLYRLWEGEMRVVSTATPSPLLPLPLDSQAQLVFDLLNVLIGVASTTFPLNQSVQFDVRPGVCVSGASPESVSRLLAELAQHGTHYLRLSRFSLQSVDKKGLVLQAFTGGLRKYLHYYRACVLSTPPTLSLLTIGFLFRKVGRQLRYLSELCCVDGSVSCGFPQGVKLLSYLYKEAQNNCSNENYPVLLSLLKSSCEPYTRFVSDWVYSGVFRDVYGEFMIQVNEDYLSSRDKHFWVQGYTLISKDVEDCVPVFLRHIGNDVYVCGKTINLLKICCPQHYICWSELPVPRIAVTFSLQEVEEIERDCAVYRGRMERVAKHSAISREEQVLILMHIICNVLFYMGGERFEELKQHLEQEQEWRSVAKTKQEDDDFSFARELRDREKRLQALEQQLEQRARKELIDQYSRLSEEAAQRERRAMWQVQRMRLDEARQTHTDTGQLFYYKANAVSPPPDPAALTPTVDSLLISETTNINDSLPKSLNPATQQVDIALQVIGSDLPEVCPTAEIVDYDFSAPFSPLEGITCQATVQPRPNWGSAVEPDLIQNHPSFSHIPIGENMSQFQDSVPKANPFGQASRSSFPLGQYTLEESQNTFKSNIYGHPSQATVQLGDESGSAAKNKKTTNEVGDLESKVVGNEDVQDQSVHSMSLPDIHVSSAPLETGDLVSVATTPLPTSNVHGHASDSHIKIGEHISDVAVPLRSSSVHGHSSDAHIKVGEYVAESATRLPSQNVHGHVSDAHIKVGQHVSEVGARLPSTNVHGHSSDSHIKVGENISDAVSPRPVPGLHGHVSDANMEMGYCVSNVPEARPRWSKHGHASDCTLQPGCGVSGDEPAVGALPGSAYGHSSDSGLGTGSIVPHLSSGLKSDSPGEQLDEVMASWAAGFGLSSGEKSEQEYLLALCAQYEVEQYEDSSSPECQLLKQVTRGPWGLPVDPTLRRATDTTPVQLSEMVSLPVLIKQAVTTPLITHVSLVNKAVVDYFFVELGVERHFEALRHFLLMEDGEFAQSLSDLLFEKLGSGQTPGELLTPLVLNSILSKALQYSLHGDIPLAANFTFALRFLPETFHPHAPDSLNCLELRYKVDWPLNIIITDSCMNKYNRLFSFLLQLKHMVWSLREVWFHLKRTALLKGAGRSVQFHQLQLYRHEMQHFVKVIQGYIANQILQVSWSEFTAKLASASDLDAIHRTHADYLNRAIFRGLLTEKAAPVMNIIHSIFSLILKFRAQLIAQPWGSHQGEAVHPSFVAMQQSYNTFKYYSHFLFKVVTKLVNRGYQPHLEDFLLRINFNNYYKDS